MEIHALGDPRTGEIRYVGIARDVYKRYAQHLNRPHNNEVKNAWMEEIKMAGLVPSLAILESNVDEDIILEREKYWIKYYFCAGAPLTNIAHVQSKTHNIINIQDVKRKVYGGHLFRNVIEARWAVFFDALGVLWEYEQGWHTLGEDWYILPDFWIDQWNCWVEVRHSQPNQKDLLMCDQLAQRTGKKCLLACGNVQLGGVSDHMVRPRFH